MTDVASFRLMSLPPELRLLVYHFVAAQTNPERGALYDEDKTFVPPVHALLQASQGTRKEATPGYYVNNVIYFRNCKQLGSALRSLSHTIQWWKHILITRTGNGVLPETIVSQRFEDNLDQLSLLAQMADL